MGSDPTFWFLLLVGFSAGFLDAVAGGGGLISLPALLAMGLPPKVALGTNKIIGICTATASSSRYLFSRTVRLGELWPLAVTAGGASMLGAFIATQVRSEQLRPIILVLLVVVGVYLVLHRKFGLKSSPGWARGGRWMFAGVALIGFWDGFFGPGTGTFLMIAFVILRGMDLLPASASSRVVNWATNLGAIILFAAKGYLDLSLVLPAAVASFVGGLCGSSWALAKGAKGIRPVFLLVTWLLIAKVAWDTWGAELILRFG